MSKLTYAMLMIARSNAQFRTEKMAEFGLKACHISYIINICNQPGISQDKLAQRIYINKSNVARQAVVLEEAGYITRRPSQADKRVQELYPTDKALDLLPQIKSILDEWSQLLTAGLSPEEAMMATELLEKMQKNAGQWMEEHG